MSQTPVTRIGSYGVVTDHDRLLLCRLSVGPHAGRWTLPGGGLEFGEHPEETLAREVEEETGLIVRPGRLAMVHTYARDEPDRFQALRFIYCVRIVGGTLRSEVNGSTDLCQWHAFDQLDQVDTIDLVALAVHAARTED